MLISSGAIHVDVMAQIEHSSIASTLNIYGHLFEAGRREPLRKLSEKITGLYVVEANPTMA